MAIQYFTPEEIADLSATTVRMAILVDLHFLSGIEYLWSGWGRRSMGGHTYQGLGHLGSISNLTQDRGPASRQFSLNLAAIEEDWLGLAIAETDEVQGRLVVVKMQLFDEDWQTVGDPIPLRFGIMGTPRVTRTEPSGDQPATRDIVVPCENLFFRRSRPPAGRWNDRDQQVRYPGDEFFEWVPTLVMKVLAWPV